ncbi:DUF3037 domain-containing protein [Mucilaginibacter gossypii]|uniref:DUF3037 domain-containing protein n=1 Tax=Mucilaginibacter gossypii TaxID=551996 RepID=UPI000DCE1978|nr:MULTISPECIES: DUF3037 domain-containing protein [Mucilaginibacter]QTE36103.1 DUF3037 domain-containing protein [Mucilaginibacter gossypii]RAV59984.1 DUF3037 domain-containing protein [Mucilaginibacter rubeus]
MKKIEYQILRYVHDRTTGEFVNVGIVVFEPQSRFLEARVLNKFSRISNFFEEFNGHFLINTLKHFQKEIKTVNLDLLFFSSSESIRLKEDPKLSDITKSILLRDNNSLQLSEVKCCLDIRPEKALQDLFVRLIEKYNSDASKEAHTDSYAWNKIYKTHFDKLGITARLKDHTVKTHNDQIKFDKAWKNGVWNCYQSLSFDLKREDAIKTKVYKWSGIIKELGSSNEKMNLFFLTTSPRDSDHLASFIKDTLSQSDTVVKVTIVTENEAEQFARRVKTAIESVN